MFTLSGAPSITSHLDILYLSKSFIGNSSNAFLLHTFSFDINNLISSR